MSKHAVLSPSSADRWMTCPGSMELSRGCENKSSSYADEGTAAHHLAAECLKSGSDAVAFVGVHVLLLQDTVAGDHFEAFEVRGEKYEHKIAYKELTRILVDEDMAGYVQTYLDYVRDVVASTGGVLLVEVAVPLTHLTREEGAYGTSDAVVIADDEIVIIDLKYGKGNEVSAVDNRQMRIYASGILYEYSLALSFERVRMAISQPRVSRAPSEWECSIAELKAFEAEVTAAALAAIAIGLGAAPATYRASDSACKFCLAKAQCPELDRVVQEAMGADFDNLLTSVPPETGRYDNELLSKKMAVIDLVESWCTAVRAAVERELLQGHEVDGYKLVQGRKGARQWSSEDEAEALLKRLKLKRDEMYSFKLISPTTAEKVLKEKPKQWEKVQELITQKDGGPSVAPITDKRPAINVEPNADGFDVVNN
jgi:hypothetical protein